MLVGHQPQAGDGEDGDEWYFYVQDREVQLYTNNKDLKNDLKNDKSGIKDWKDLVKNTGILNN